MFGRTIDSSESAIGDLKGIVQIRNNVIHYKHSLYEGPDKPMKNLRQRGVTHPLPKGTGCAWHLELCTSESIRFCINTIARMVEQMAAIRTPYYKEHCLGFFPELYTGISDHQVRQIFEENNTEPDSLHNDFFGQTE